MMDPCSEWTQSLCRFIQQQREELAEIVKTSQGDGTAAAGLASMLEEQKPETSTQLKLITYTFELEYVFPRTPGQTGVSPVDPGNY